MRFAAANSFSAADYASAGRAASNSLVNSFAAARRNAPDWTGLARTSMNTRSAERQTAMKAEADVATAGMRAFGNVKDVQIKGAYEHAALKTKLKSQKSRMAGKLGALGGFKIPGKSNSDKYDKLIDKYKSQKQEVPETSEFSFPEFNGQGVDAGQSVAMPEAPRLTVDGTKPPTNPSSPPVAATIPTGAGTFSGGTLDVTQANAIKASADRLGVDPYTLGGLFEMESTHRPNVWGGAGRQVSRPDQFGPGARQEVGLPDGDMTIAQQLPYVEKYFQQRGFKPGEHGATELYRTVLVGNPGQSGTDSWGTNSDAAAKRMVPGGDLYKRAQKLYGTWTPGV